MLNIPTVLTNIFGITTTKVGTVLLLVGLLNVPLFWPQEPHTAVLWGHNELIFDNHSLYALSCISPFPSISFYPWYIMRHLSSQLRKKSSCGSSLASHTMYSHRRLDLTSVTAWKKAWQQSSQYFITHVLSKVREWK